MPPAPHNHASWKRQPLSLGLMISIIGALAQPACIESKCFRNADCADGRLCQQATGACQTAECQSSDQCGPARVCKQGACVPGCKGDSDCVSGQKCFETQCRTVEAECQCPLAPKFCLTDVNPTSAAYGTDICFPSESSGGTLLFFGSVYCSHCKLVFAELQEVENGLRANGLNPTLLWVQPLDRPLVASDIPSQLPDVHSPVVEDKRDIGVWQAYQVDWYYVAVLESHGCMSARFGPLSGGDFHGGVGTSIANAWKKSMKPVCPGSVEGSPGVTPALY